MTATPAPLEQWLERLVTADPEDRRTISIEGMDVGLTSRRVRCQRHKVGLNWLSAFAHLDRTEASYRLQNGSHTRLHQPGDLVPAGPPPLNSPWPTTTCRSKRCRSTIIWATTESGARMPVDARPDPAGTVALVRAPEAVAGDAPLALVLHTDTARAEVVDRHTAHFATCPDAKSYRRRS